MEDPKLDWRIQEYSFSKEDDEANVVKWILTKGYAIGKKIAISGIVILSAPLVVPPLVVFSAIGVAVSVPFGLLFASYAGTNKLMSMLLPTPPSPLMLEYYIDESEPETGEKVNCKLGLVDRGDVYRHLIGGVEENEDEYGQEVEGYCINKEDMKLMEDMNVGVDIELELDDGSDIGECEPETNERVDYKLEWGDDGDDYRQLIEAIEEHEDELYGPEVEGYNYDKEDNELMEVINQGVDIEVELNDGGVYIEECEPETEERVDRKVGLGDYGDDDRQIIEAIEENEDEYGPEVEGYYSDKEDKELMEDMNQGVDDVHELDDGSDDYKNNEQTLMTNVDGDVDGREIEDDMPQSGNVVGDDQGCEEDVGILEEERKGEEPLGDENKIINTHEDEKLHGNGRVYNTIEVDYAVVESDAKVVFENVKDVETTIPIIVKETNSEKLVDIGSENNKLLGETLGVVVLSDGNDENKFNTREVEELDMVAREVIGDANNDERNMEFEEDVLIESMVTHEITSGNAPIDGSEDTVLRITEEHLIPLNAELPALDDDESSLNLLDERNTKTNLEILEVGNIMKEVLADENVDLLGRSPLEPAPLDTYNAKDASKTFKKMPFKEENIDDEKMWEKIGAMRTIVGYKAPSQPTCIAELKALYVFTGVEPPASFEDDSGPDELNAKLKFLMAIVGVK